MKPNIRLKLLLIPAIAYCLSAAATERAVMPRVDNTAVLTDTAARQIDEFLMHTEALETAARRWLEQADPKPVDSEIIEPTYAGKYTQWLTASYIRRLGGYTGMEWTLTAGPTQDNAFLSFIKYVEDNAIGAAAYFSRTTSIPGFTRGKYGDGFTNTLDLRHMAATMSALLFTGAVDIVTDDLAGWAGDLQTFVVNLLKSGKDDTQGLGSADAYYRLTKQYLARPGTSYDMDDMLADVDALNIISMVKQSGTTLSEAMTNYYGDNGGSAKRFTRFVRSFGEIENAFTLKITEYVTWRKYNFFDPRTHIYHKQLTSITDAQRHGVIKGYKDFLEELSAKE